MNILPLYLPQRGCPHRCVYCNQPLTIGAAEDRPHWKERLKSTLPPAGAEAWEVAFYGGTFSALPPDEMNACFLAVEPYLRDERVQSIRVSTRPDAVPEETLDTLWRRGVRTVELGVESLDDRVLLKSGRGHDAEQAVEACHRIKRKGFRLGIHLMCGLPSQDETSWRETVQRAVELPLDLVRLAPTLVLKDTPLEKLYRRGAYRPQTLEEALRQCEYAYPRFYLKGIAIARIGLGLSDEHGCGEEKIVAGPWHPALRHEVESRLVRRSVPEALRSEAADEFFINPRDVSIVVGEGRRNLSAWEAALARPVHVRQSGAVPRHRFFAGSRHYSFFAVNDD